MKNYYVDTCGKLRDILTEHCNLSLEQYKEIRGRLIDLVAEIRKMDGEENMQEAERKANELCVIIGFLKNTGELMLTEYEALYNMIVDIWNDMHAEILEKRIRKPNIWNGVI